MSVASLDSRAVRSGEGLPSVWTSAVVATWFAFTTWAAASGGFRAWSGFGPLSALQVAILGPIVVGSLTLAVSGHARRLARGIDPVFLCGMQVLRVLGASHLVTWGLGRMAGGFALPVGLGNLLVSVLALWVTCAAARGHPAWRAWALALTWCGLAEFAMTVALAIGGALRSSTPWDPPIAADGYASVSQLPIVLFPAFLIPFFSLVHIVTLVRLRGRE